MILVGIGSMAAFIAVSSLLLWLGGLSSAPSEARLRTLGQTRRPSPMDAPFSERVLLPVFEGLARALMQLLPQTFVTRTARQLVTAGRPVSTQAFFTIVIVTGGLIPSAVLVLLLPSGSLGLAAAFAVVLLLVGLGALAPFLWLRRRVRNRKLAIWKSLADGLDLITVAVEAGLGLDAALRQVAEKLHGPLADEIAHTLREIGMGRARREALQEMAERADVTDLTTFINAIIQAETLGTSLGRVLRAQSSTIRTHRRQRAEETARKAPVKMVFPLVLCIIPSFFIVVLGPVVIRVINYLNE